MAKKTEQKKTFVIYEDMMNIVLTLPDEAALDFVRTLFSHFLQKDYDATPISAGLLESFKERISADAEKYEEVCEKRRIAGSIGGKQKQANGSKSKQMVANATLCYENSSKCKQNVADNDNDSDNVNDNDNDNVFSTKRTKKMFSNENTKEVVDMWNASFANTDVPKVTIVKAGSKREKMLNARIEEFGMQKIAEAIKLASASTFLKASSWFSFDWFICPNNFVKVAEGNYQDHAAAAGGGSNKTADNLQEFYNRAVAWASEDD